MCSACMFVTLYTMPLHELNCAPIIYISGHLAISSWDYFCVHEAVTHGSYIVFYTLSATEPLQCGPASRTNPMSHTPLPTQASSGTSSNFRPIFDAALIKY
ncbi:hypothetical protein BGW80DRAFT_1395076, partial [Lactifluus volemus]